MVRRGGGLRENDVGSSVPFSKERVKLFGWTHALNGPYSLEASYKVLVVTKLTQAPSSPRDRSARAFSSVLCPPSSSFLCKSVH